MATTTSNFPQAKFEIVVAMADPAKKAAWDAFNDRGVFVGLNGKEFHAPRKLAQEETGVTWKDEFARGMELYQRGWLETVHKDGTTTRPKHGTKTKYSGAALRELNRTRGTGKARTPLCNAGGESTADKQ